MEPLWRLPRLTAFRASSSGTSEVMNDAFRLRHRKYREQSTFPSRHGRRATQPWGASFVFVWYQSSFAALTTLPNSAGGCWSCAAARVGVSRQAATHITTARNRIRGSTHALQGSSILFQLA